AHAVARPPRKSVGEIERIHHAHGDAFGRIEGIAGRPGCEQALQRDGSVAAERACGEQAGVLDGHWRIDRVAAIAATVTVHVLLVGVRIRGAVVVGATDTVAVGIAAAGGHARAGLAGVGERASHRVAVVARAAVALGRVRTEAGVAIAGARVVA